METIVETILSYGSAEFSCHDEQYLIQQESEDLLTGNSKTPSMNFGNMCFHTNETSELEIDA